MRHAGMGHFYLTTNRNKKSVAIDFAQAEGAALILLSWNTGQDEQNPCCASIFKPWTWFTDARPDRFFKVLH